MDFALNEEQTLLRDSVAKFSERQTETPAKRIELDADGSLSARSWSAMAEFGWLLIPFPESLGGLGGKIEDVALLMEEFGKGLLRVPYIENIMLAGQLMSRGGYRAGDPIAALLEGNRQFALAVQERQGRQSMYDIRTKATKTSDGYLITGRKDLVMNGGAADTLVVLARTSGGQYEKDGLTLFVVDADAPGITRTPLPFIDGTRAANFDFNEVPVSSDAVIGAVDAAWDILWPTLQEARIAMCAEAVGLMDSLYRKTVEYSKTRVQFDVPIGSFQALQHRMVDMFMATEQARSMLYRAICEWQQDEPTRDRTVSAMKAHIGKSGRRVGEEAIQIHGGMGMTDELDIGHYVKRLMVLNNWMGSADDCLEEFASETGNNL